jgi:hypothetical protein
MKWGLDPQEDALKRGKKFSQPHWGEEPEVDWGKLTLDDCGTITHTPVQTLPGDYRGYYANVRAARSERRFHAILATSLCDKQFWISIKTLVW